MKERPILFSAPMVKAILNDTKTMTRRMMKVQPPNDGADYQVCRILAGDRRNVGKYRWVNKNCLAARVNAPYFSLPWENVDRLWVKETWGVGSRPDPSGCIEGLEYKADELFLEDPLDSIQLWEARTPEGVELAEYESDGWRPSLFMPRWASRITLEITDIKVERLQEISHEDAIAEGVCEYCSNCRKTPPFSQPCRGCGEYDTAQRAFFEIWEKINGKKPGKTWQDNPWVWVVEFRRVEG